jgi:UDP-galactopyranose mutase
MYDYLIVGSGLFGSVFAHQAAKFNKRVLVVEKRAHVGGNIYCESRDGIDIHYYGAHIFHTKNERVWSFVNQFTSFNNFINSPIANYRGKIYNLPFNMNTFNQMWDDVITPLDAQKKIEMQREAIKGPITNLEEQAISLVGNDIYEILIKGYTEKQWNRSCKELPPSIIKRLPVRFRYDNNYFDDPYQGIPKIGYNALIETLLEKAEVILNVDFNKERSLFKNMAKTILYTGELDQYFNYRFGQLEYRSLHFEHKKYNVGNYQGVAVVNYTAKEIPYTRSIEHVHFALDEKEVTWVTYEYPRQTGEPYYPIVDEKNLELYKKYYLLAKEESNFLFGGRLAEYAYYDMDKTIESALKLSDEVLR